MLEANEPNAPAVESAFQAVPDSLVAEIIDGELRVLPRPARRHPLAASLLGGGLHGPFRRGKEAPASG